MKGNLAERNCLNYSDRINKDWHPFARNLAGYSLLKPAVA